MDVIDVPLQSSCPKDYQRENWLVEPTTAWQWVGRLGWRDLHDLADPVSTLWLDGHRSSHGRNNRVPLSSARTLNSSLRFIHVNQLVLCRVLVDGDRRLQGRFRHAGADYWLWVTHPEYGARYPGKPGREYQLGECFVTISLGEPYHGDCYKLIAAIIQPEDAR